MVHSGRTVVPLVAALAAALAGGCAPEPVPTSAPDLSAPAAAPARSAGSSAAPGRCHTGDLAATLGPKREEPVDAQGELGAAGAHYAVDLVWTNRSTSTCTLYGFGGVDLVGARGGADDRYSLPRAADTPATVRLAPGASAHTVIRYIDPSGSLPFGESRSLWTPDHLEVTPPDETTSLTVPWAVGTPVDREDSASGAAAASVSAIQPDRG